MKSVFVKLRLKAFSKDEAGDGLSSYNYCLIRHLLQDHF